MEYLILDSIGGLSKILTGIIAHSVPVVCIAMQYLSVKETFLQVQFHEGIRQSEWALLIRLIGLISTHMCFEVKWNNNHCTGEIFIVHA